MASVVHFDLSADEPKRAANFYKNVFGWNIEKWDGPLDYWLVKTGEGIDGGIMRRANAQETTTNIVEVQSIDQYTAKVVASGGEILEPKKTIPGIGYLATCIDTEGNTFAIMQYDESVPV